MPVLIGLMSAAWNGDWRIQQSQFSKSLPGHWVRKYRTYSTRLLRRQLHRYQVAAGLRS